jgi:glycosyltransferase involved in cell wall biosynthesis
MQKTKILHIAPAYQIKGGGIFEVVKNLSTSQCKDKNTLVDILCLETFIEIQDLSKVTYSLLPSKITQFALMYATFNFLRSRMDRYDIIHIHGAWSFQFLLVAPFIFSHKKRIVYQPHGLLSPICVKKSWFIKKLAWLFYQRYFLKYSRNIVCCSKKEESEISSICVESNKIKVIPNGLDDEFFLENSPNTFKCENRFMFFSQVTPIKNLESVFHAISTLKSKDSYNVYLDIYGYGQENYVCKLKALINKLSISENISFKGAVSRSKRVAIYDKYTYFILPSLSENFAIVVLEALSRGCKVFVSTQTPWIEYEHNNLTLLDPDESSIYSALKSQLIDNQHPVNVKSDSRLSLAEFNWDKISAQFKKIYFPGKEELL